jgi:hypothetical protein
MGRKAVLIFYAVVMIGIIVAVDFLFFRHRFYARLIANIVTVLAFGVLYSIFMRRK